MRYLDELPRCPICGSKAFISRDTPDGYFMGYSVGCPRACIKDGIHGFDDYESFHAARLVLHSFTTKEEAIKSWKDRVERGV